MSFLSSLLLYKTHIKSSAIKKLDTKMIKKRLFLSIFISSLLLPLYTQADNIPIFTASTAEYATVNNPFRLTFTISFPGTLSNADIKDFVPPKLEGFKVLMGPSRSTNTTVQQMNGKNTVNDKISYTYILSASHKGNFTIAEATVFVNGQRLHTQPLSVKVLPAGQTLPAKQKPTEPNVFITMNISERSPLVNSPIVLEYKLYTTTFIDSIANIEQLISPEHFKVESINLEGSQWQLEHQEGKNYHTTVFRKLLLYPRRSGALHIGDLYIDTYFHCTNEDTADTFFSERASREIIKKRVSCPGITINAHK